MRISFTPQAWEDYLYWQTADKKMLKRINLLIKDITRISRGVRLKERASLNR